MVASEFLSRLFQRAPRRQRQRQRQQQRQEPQERSEQTPTPRREPPLHLSPVGYMGRATIESPGIKDSSCRVSGSPSDPYYLPTLPQDQPSLFASLCENDDQDIQQQQLRSQEQSPLFTRLPPEIRQIIYLHAFGGRRIHIDYDFSAQRYKSYLHKKWSWWHRVCDDDSNCPEKDFVCPETAAAETAMLQLGSSSWVKNGFEYKIDAVNWLRCCKIGYQESLPVLYSSNTFVLSQGIDLLPRVTRLMPRDHLALLTSVSIEIDVYKICKRAPPNMDAGFRDFYEGFFDLIRQRLPNLRGLSLSISGIPSPPRAAIEWSDEREAMWVGPWEELSESRRWKRLEIAVPAVWFEEFEEIGRRRDRNKGERSYNLVQGLESFQKGW